MPVVIQIHGGPEAQARPWFYPLVQYLAAEAGIAVITPNVRGSDGYGKSYLALDDGRLREDSGARHRRAARLDRHAAASSTRVASLSSAAATAATWCWPRSCTSGIDCAQVSTSWASRTS
jgi:hypothetical protein